MRKTDRDKTDKESEREREREGGNTLTDGTDKKVGGLEMRDAGYQQ